MPAKKPAPAVPPCPLTSDPAMRAAADAAAAAVQAAFPPGMSQPALRALAAAELRDLEALTRVRERDVASLHGMGPKGVRLLREALAARGWEFLP